MGAQCASRPHITELRTWAHDVRYVTAGDLIRAALDGGESQLGLAKRLADRTNDADPEVKRWRYVVMRASRGGEPQDSNIARIGKVLGGGTDALKRERGARVDRLAVVEAAVSAILDGQKEGLKGQDEIRGQLEEIRRILDERLPAGRARRQESP